MQNIGCQIQDIGTKLCNFVLQIFNIGFQMCNNNNNYNNNIQMSNIGLQNQIIFNMG